MTNTTPNSPGSGRDSASEAVREARDRLGEQARSQADNARAQAQGMADEATRRAEAMREQAGGEIGDVSEALRKAADELGGDRYSAQILRYASHGLEDIARSVKSRDVGSIAGELSAFGRRNPVAFLGVAALTGFAIARFATARTERAGVQGDTGYRGVSDYAGRGPTVGTAPDFGPGTVPTQPVPPAGTAPVTHGTTGVGTGIGGSPVARPAPDVHTRREIE